MEINEFVSGKKCLLHVYTHSVFYSSASGLTSLSTLGLLLYPTH